MKTTASSNPNKQCFCPFRKKWIARTPEEEVRQEFLAHLVGPFGCPPHQILVETSLRALSSSLAPNRRLDILVMYTLNGSPSPLLVVECKAKKSSSAKGQAGGYNFYIKAPYLGIVIPSFISMKYKGNPFFEGAFCDMPRYQELKQILSSLPRLWRASHPVREGAREQAEESST